jgi:predicted O-methyltransferase YrrM
MKSNEDFVIFCYETLLGRKPDLSGQQQYTEALNTGALSREQLLLLFIESPEFTSLRQRIEEVHAMPEFVPAGHYYSVVPSAEDRAAALAKLPTLGELPGIQLRPEGQLSLLAELQPFYAACPFTATTNASFRYYFENRSYSYGDGLTLYAMMRRFRPARVIEIGSGYSSALMLDVNDLHFEGKIQFTFIEPYTELLRSLLRPSDLQPVILEQKLQSVDPAVVDSLQANDMLFIDSTHVAKLNSDVNRLFFEFLPRLKPGVLIHIHDIFWPFEYPASWTMEKRAWNECYLLHAFLQYNPEFEIVFFSSQMLKLHGDWFTTNVPRFLKNSGGHIWLRRR